MMRMSALTRIDQKFLSLALVESVEAHARIGGIELQVECSSLDSLLLVVGEMREAGREGGGDEEVGYVRIFQRPNMLIAA